MRKRPPLATTLVLVAVFISLTGTAMAAVIVSSNHQVAAHTIAGTNAPVGDNENLISGSVGTSDLHGNALTGSKVADDGLTGADIDESTLRVSSVIARPAGGTLAAGGLTTGGATPYSLTGVTFTQRPGELIPQIKATLAIPSGKVSTLCQVEMDLELDGKRLAVVRSAGSNSAQLETTTVALRGGAAAHGEHLDYTHRHGVRPSRGPVR